MDMPFLGRIVLEELETSRRVIKQILDRNNSAGWRADRLTAIYAGAGCEPHAHGFIAMPSYNRGLAYRCQARQRFAPEAKSFQRLQLLCRTKLAGGMPLEGQFNFFRANSRTIVADPKQPSAATAGLNMD